MKDSPQKINPEKLRRIERKYNVRLGVCLDMGGVKANAMNAPRYNVPTAVQRAELAAAAAIDEYKASGAPREPRGRGFFALPATREYTALARTVELANDLAAFRYAEWDCDGFEGAIEAVAKLGDGAATRAESIRVVGVVTGILATAAQTEASVLQQLPDEDLDVTLESVRLLRAVSARLAQIASTLTALHERPEAS